MELYSNYPGHSISMADSPILRAALLRLFRSDVFPEVIIETGTNLGLGSTRILAECVIEAGRAEEIRIETIESQYWNYLSAFRNLQQFPFVSCHFGCSLCRELILPFLHGDEMLQNHQNYSGVYIDRDGSGRELAEWYGAEAIGQTQQAGYRDDILGELIGENLGKRLMFLLDSAGGMGLLEFQATIAQMLGVDAYFLCDDTHHIKHKRTLQWMQEHPAEYLILASEESWVLADAHPISLVEA